METFCAVSDSLEHGPAGIWAYLNPVLDKIAEDYSEIDTYSISIVMDLQLNINRRQTSFSYESGHGKGIPDGVGGSVKRSANKSVLHGKDITNAAQFVQCMKDQDSSMCTR